MGSSLKLGSQFRVLFIRVPYYIGDMKRDPNSENYPYRSQSLGIEMVSIPIGSTVAPLCGFYM